MAKKKSAALKVEGANIDEIMTNLEQKLRAMIEDKEQEIKNLNSAMTAAEEKRDATKAKADEEYENEYYNLDEKRDQANDELSHLQELLARVDP